MTWTCLTDTLTAAGDAGNEVMTTAELAKLKFDPSHYRVNAYQGLAYDPMRKYRHKMLAVGFHDILCALWELFRSSAHWARFQCHP